MKALPLTFRADLLRAIYAGDKTETRRTIKAGNSQVLPGMFEDVDLSTARARVQPGEPRVSELRARCAMAGNASGYRVVSVLPRMRPDDVFWTRLPRAPRADSRSVLELLEVRAKRVRDMTNADALAEGVMHLDVKFPHTMAALDRFAWLWDAINGEGAWDRNEWVWCYRFNPRRGRIDKLYRTKVSGEVRRP